MELLLLVIPFEDTGAMETFLLNAIANESAYDAEIIRKGNQFVEEVDKERKYLTTGNWEDALIVLQEERRKCIILVLFIIFSNAIIVFAVGYCMVYSFQKDLIEKNRRNKRKEPKKNLSRKHKYRWKNKDYQLIGWLLIIVAIVFYGAYVNWQGIQNAQKQELFLTTRIDNDTYIVVMTDGDEAILEKDRTGKDGKLKICKDKYMKVDCKNLLLEKKKYRRASGDGE